MIMSLKQKKIKFKPRIKLNHNIYRSLREMIIINKKQPKFALTL